MEIQSPVPSTGHYDRTNGGDNRYARTDLRRLLAGVRCRVLLAVLAAVVTFTAGLTMTAAPASAGIASPTWTGGGANANWTTGANWLGGVAPSPGASLVFPAGAARTTNTNNFPAGTAFGSIRFTGSGATYTLGGNQVTLGSGGVSMEDSTNADVITIGLPIRLGADQRFSLGLFHPGFAQFTYSGAIDLAGHILTFSAAGQGAHRLTGALSGAGTIAIADGNSYFCSVIFAGTNTSTGSTTVNQGCAAIINGDYSARSTTVGLNGLLRGKGTLGTLTALGSSATVRADSDVSPASILTVKGPLGLRAGSYFEPNISGSVPGTGYSQVVAGSTVSLGGVLNLLGKFHPTAGQTYTLIANHGVSPISGTFAFLPEGAIVNAPSGATYRITYKGGTTGRDVVLTALTSGSQSVWTGLGSDAYWTTPANWSGNLAPKAGDDLVFPAGAARTTNVDNYAAGTTFRSMGFTGSAYAVSGNRIVLNGGVVGVGFPGSTSRATLSMPITLGEPSEFLADPGGLLTVSGALDLAGHDLYVSGAGNQVLSGPLTGAGKILDSSSGEVHLSGSSPDVGTIELGGGYLYVDGDYHLRSITGRVGSSATLSGTGAVAAVTLTDGSVTLLGKLTVTGKLSLAPGTVFATGINGSAQGTFGQLAVKGPVVLGGATLQSYTGISPAVGQRFTIVSNLGGVAVSGTFAGLPEGAMVTDIRTPSISYRISYKGGTSGRDVTLTVLNPTLLPEADLNVTQAATPDPVAVGGKARFAITVTNYGPVSTKVSLRDRVPEGTTLVSMSQLAGWSCRTGTGAAGQGINCTSDGELAAGSSQTFILVVRVGAGAGTSVTNKATVSGSTADSNTADNTSLSTIAVG